MSMQGDVLTDQKVLLDDKQAGFVGMIPPDCRAVSVAINDITGIAGFAKAGDYVDVMVVSDSREKNKVTGEILLQNVLLLAINKTSMGVGLYILNPRYLQPLLEAEMGRVAIGGALVLEAIGFFFIHKISTIDV